MEPSSSQTREELGFVPKVIDFEDVWSDLHALKKLYGLLQKSNGKIPPGELPDSLDEKSRFLLRKLLDGATQHALQSTQHALQSQAKIVSSTPEADRLSSQKSVKLSVSPQQEPQDLENLQNCNPAPIVVKQEAAIAPQADPPGFSQAKREQCVNGSMAQTKFPPKKCQVYVKGGLEKKDSEKSMRTSDMKSLKTAKPGVSKPRRPIHHVPRDQAAIDRASKSGSKREELEPPEQPKRGDHGPPLLQGPPEKPCSMPRGARSPLDEADVAPSYKRNRVVETTNPPSRPGEVLTQPKEGRRRRDGHYRPSSRSRVGGGPTAKTQQPKSHQSNDKDGLPSVPRRTGSFKDQTATIHRKKDTVGSGQKHYPPDSPPSRRGPVTGPEKPPPPSHHHQGRVSHPRPQLSRLGAMRIRGSRRHHQSREASVLDRIPRGYSSASSSDSSTTTLTRSSRTTDSLTAESTRRCNGPRPRTLDHRSQISVARRTPSHRSLAVVPIGTARRRAGQGEEAKGRRPPILGMPSQHSWVVGPRSRTRKGSPQKKPEKKGSKKKDLGHLQRFKNKLAIIFHHHHHHHHHLHHDGHVADEHAAQHHLSPWRYLRRLLPRRDQERAAAQQGKHGYLHVLLDALLRHVWGTRQRRAAKARRRRLAGKMGSNKPHWWQRVRRRGGVKLASRKKPRLRLAFTRARSRGTHKA